ncbi:MAG: hypothetical protein AAF628_19410 [Planctomycetota bacterium]
MTRVHIERVVWRGLAGGWTPAALGETLASAVRAELSGERLARPASMSDAQVRVVHRAAREVADRVRAARGGRGVD